MASDTSYPTVRSSIEPCPTAHLIRVVSTPEPDKPSFVDDWSVPKHRRLFVRLYLATVFTIIAFVSLAVSVLWLSLLRFDEEWVEQAVARVNADEHRLRQLIDAEDWEQAYQLIDIMEHDLDARIHVHRLSPSEASQDDAPAHYRVPPGFPLGDAEFERLAQGRPLVRRHLIVPPTLQWRILTADGKALRAVVFVTPPREGKFAFWWPLILFVGTLGLGTWPLARQMTRRLAELQQSTQKLAAGHLSHRVPTPRGRRGDELDQLAHAFNRMADRIEMLVGGQRQLLANVSHELRTPLSRMRVLLELMDERIERVVGPQLTETRDAVFRSAHPAEEQLVRVRQGLHDLSDDVQELESLVTDLLTSGRLDLAEGQLQRRELVDLVPLLQRVGRRTNSDVLFTGPRATVAGDELLLERLFSNLLHNARRACPEGGVRLELAQAGRDWEIAVEDEGPGVPLSRRREIFEPFLRLDSARSRDRGGAGLGLYLCRQIAGVHDGAIRVTGRTDGRAGARFVVNLPRIEEVPPEEISSRQELAEQAPILLPPGA